MSNSKNRSIRVFLCHASSDKPKVRELYLRLVNDGVDAWLDKEKLIPGQNWQIEIPKAVRNSDVVLVCLSPQSANKEGFVQKEIKIALDAADEKPEGTIFIIPVRLEECNVPERISQFHWVDLFSENGYEWLLKALRLRANAVGATFEPFKQELLENKTEGDKRSEEFSQENESFNAHQSQNESKASSSDVGKLKNKISKQIDELEGLQKTLEKPINIGAFIGGGILYTIFGSIIVMSIMIAFDVNNFIAIWIELGVVFIVTFFVIRHMYSERKRNTEESIMRTKTKIQNLRRELQSLTEQG